MTTKNDSLLNPFGEQDDVEFSPAYPVTKINIGDACVYCVDQLLQMYNAGEEQVEIEYMSVFPQDCDECHGSEEALDYEEVQAGKRLEEHEVARKAWLARQLAEMVNTDYLD